MADSNHSLCTVLFRRITFIVVGGFAVFVASLLIEFGTSATQIEQASLRGLAEHYRARVADGADWVTGTAGLPNGVVLRRLDGGMIAAADRWAMDAVPGYPGLIEEHAYQIGHDIRTGERLASVAVVLERGVIGPEPAILQVARPMTDFRPIFGSFVIETLDEMWWIFVLLLIGCLAVVKVTIDRSMRGVLAASEMAASISPDQIDQRLPVVGLPSEVAPLADRVNDALDRLERGYEAERSFAASAAHELRTPLSILRAEVERFPAGTGRDAALRQIDRMARRIGQLLQLVRIDTWRPDPSDGAEAVQVARSVLSDYSPAVVLAGGDVTFRAEGTAQGWIVDRVLFEIVLGNLLDNAARYGGDHPQVRVTIADRRLVVEDSGGGIPLADWDRIFDLFWRRGDNGQGAGIGLALVARIAARTGCRVSVGRSDLGGAALSFAAA